MASTLKVNTIQGASNTTTTVKTNGGTDALTIDTSGRILQPAKPAFRAHKSSTQTASGSNELITWNTTEINQGNCFGSNVFTAPIAGIYVFSIVALTPNNSSIEDFKFMNQKSGGSLTNLVNFRNANASGHETMGGTMIHNMDANETVGVYLTSANDAIYGDSDRWTTWCGYLLG